MTPGCSTQELPRRPGFALVATVKFDHQRDHQVERAGVFVSTDLAAFHEPVEGGKPYIDAVVLEQLDLCQIVFTRFPLLERSSIRSGGSLVREPIREQRRPL